MSKEYTCLGMMSGTSGDGVDASIIQSDGLDKFTILKEKYYQYDENLWGACRTRLGGQMEGNGD